MNFDLISDEKELENMDKEAYSREGYKLDGDNHTSKEAQSQHIGYAVKNRFPTLELDDFLNVNTDLRIVTSQISRRFIFSNRLQPVSCEGSANLPSVCPIPKRYNEGANIVLYQSNLQPAGHNK